MKRMGIFFPLAIAVVLVTLPANSATEAAKKDQGALQDKYHVIQVGEFDIQPGVNFPPNYLASLPQQVIQRLKDSKKFTQVLASGRVSIPGRRSRDALGRNGDGLRRGQSRQALRRVWNGRGAGICHAQIFG